MASGVYQIVNKNNGKVYVGSAVKLSKRFRSHKNLLKSNKHQNVHLQRAWNKYGENEFSFEIIELVEDVRQLIEREQFWMNLLSPEYNICKIAGSSLGTRHTAEAKKRMGESHRGFRHSEETKKKMRAAARDRKHSDETRRKLSEINKGKTLSKETRRKIGLTSRGSKNPSAILTEEHIKEIRIKYKTGFYTQKMLGEEYGVHQTHIHRIINLISWREI